MRAFLKTRPDHKETDLQRVAVLVVSCEQRNAEYLLRGGTVATTVCCTRTSSAVQRAALDRNLKEHHEG